MLRNWLREWLGIERLDDHVFDHYREIDELKKAVAVGQTRTVKVAGSGRGARPVVLEFVGGVLVDRGATVER